MQKLLSILSKALLAFLLVCTLIPFYLLLINSFKLNRDIVYNPWLLTTAIEWENYTTTLGQIGRPMANTLVVTLVVILGTIVLSMLASFSFVRYQFFAKEFIYYLIIAMLMIPGFVMLVPQFVQVVDMGLYDTYLALIMPPIAYNVALGTFLIRTSMGGISKSLFEAAEIEGAHDLQILWHIVTPLSIPVMATVTIMTGLASWNNYIWPLVASSSEKTRQISVALVNLVVSIERGNGALFAGYVMASLPLLLLFCFTSKQFVAGLTQGAVKG